MSIIEDAAKRSLAPNAIYFIRDKQLLTKGVEECIVSLADMRFKNEVRN
jgi:hypothetical protein